MLPDGYLRVMSRIMLVQRASPPHRSQAGLPLGKSARVGAAKRATYSGSSSIRFAFSSLAPWSSRNGGYSSRMSEA